MRKRAITTFLSRKSMITRSSIAFEDFLGSSIVPQVMPPWWVLNSNLSSSKRNWYSQSMWVGCWRPHTKAKARAEDILKLMLILKRMLNVKKMQSPEGKISWCLWWCWMLRRCRGNARADDNVTSSQAYLHLRPSPLAPFFNASHGWVCRKDVTFFGIRRRLSYICSKAKKSHLNAPNL